MISSNMKKLIRKIQGLSAHSIRRVLRRGLTDATFLLVGFLMLLAVVILIFLTHIIFPRLALLALPFAWGQLLLSSLLIVWVLREARMVVHFIELFDRLPQSMGNPPH